jgi:hypothetical protein
VAGHGQKKEKERRESGRRGGQEKKAGWERAQGGKRIWLDVRVCCFSLSPFCLKLGIQNHSQFEFEPGVRGRYKTRFQNIYFICNPNQNIFLFQNYLSNKFNYKVEDMRG